MYAERRVFFETVCEIQLKEKIEMNPVFFAKVVIDLGMLYNSVLNEYPKKKLH